MPSLPLAALSGVLLFLSFPNLGHPAVAWLAVAPLLVAVARANPWQGLRLGAVTGVVHFSGTLYWIPAVMVDYGGLPAAAAWPVHALLVALLALFPALFAAGVADLAVRFGARGLLFAPALWVTTELGRMHLFTGFPWALLGYSQVPFPAVAQTASIAGVLGVSALVVLVNATIAYAVVAAPGTRRTPVLATAAVVLAAAAFGAWRLEDGSLLRAGDPLRVAALQGNVRQDEKWNPLRGDAILDTYLGQTRRAAAAGAGLVVWPESATPFALDRDPRGEAVRAVARETAAHLLVGTTEVVREGGTRYYNAAYLIEAGSGIDVRCVSQAAPGARSGSMCRCGRRSSSCRRWWSRWPVSPPARSPGRCRSAEARWAPPSATRSSILVWCGSSCSAAAACCPRSRTTPGTAARPLRTSTFSRRRCGRSSRGVSSSVPRTPASAA